MTPVCTAPHAARPTTSRPRRVPARQRSREAVAPVEILAILCVVAWLLGVLSGYTGGSSIHGLLVVAAVAVIVRVLQVRRGGRD